jgi:hypothetical protein
VVSAWHLGRRNLVYVRFTIEVTLPWDGNIAVVTALVAFLGGRRIDEVP